MNLVKKEYKEKLKRLAKDKYKPDALGNKASKVKQNDVYDLEDLIDDYFYMKDIIDKFKRL